MQKKPDRAIIWDMDGVIVDTGPSHFAAWREFLQSRGETYTEEDFRHDFGRRNPEILKRRFPALTAEEIEDLSKIKEELFRRKVRNRLRLFPGVVRLLDIQRQADFSIALASSAPRENIDLILASLQIAGYFDCAISSEQVTKGKPDPEAFLLAARELGVAPSRCIVIEDAAAGVEAAGAAGMKCIAVTNTHHASALAKADVVTDNLEKIGRPDLDRLVASE